MFSGATRLLLRRASPRSATNPTTRSALRAFLSTYPSSVSGFLQFSPDDPAHNVKVDGYVRSVRAMKKTHFVAVGDGSCMEVLQAVIPAAQAEGLTIGAAVRLHGSWVPSRGSGQTHELQVQQAEIMGPSDAETFPIQKKYHTPEFLRTLPHLRTRVPFNAAVQRLRSDLIASFTRFFADRRFTQTHTPILTSSDCEGGGEVFHVGAGKDALAPSDQSASHFFRRPVYTTVSAQLHLEALSQALGNVWTLSPTFRAEQSDTPRHLSEFYMLEAEVSFTDSLESVMDLVEDMLRHVASDLSTSGAVKDFRERVGNRWEGLLQKTWPRITYTEAIKLLEEAPDQFEHRPVWGEGLQTDHEKYIATRVGLGNSPVFVTNYPRDIKAFYMKTNEDDDTATTPGPTVACFDLLVPDFCEIAGGSMREHRLQELVVSMRRHGMDPDVQPDDQTNPSSTQANNLDWYLDLRRWGCPPHGGFGLGFDRLLCYLSGVQTIRDTVPFPRWSGRCDC
ncbi:asparaginyl-tRNA synthetase [Xylariomycetidae sp. FL0641]|nr:asparaginyl-tRNA synthetase [Xylariomycetidae sp. FL0641]